MFLYIFNKEHAFGSLTSEAFMTTSFKTPSRNSELNPKTFSASGSLSWKPLSKWKMDLNSFSSKLGLTWLWTWPEVSWSIAENLVTHPSISLHFLLSALIAVFSFHQSILSFRSRCCTGGKCFGALNWPIQKEVEK